MPTNYITINCPKCDESQIIVFNSNEISCVVRCKNKDCNCSIGVFSYVVGDTLGYSTSTVFDPENDEEE